MIISTVKCFHTYTIDKKRLDRLEFGEKLSVITDREELKKEIADTLEEHGRVYGIYKKKELLGVYIFERVENYFIRKESGIKLGNRELNLEKFWYGTDTAAFRLKKCICLEEVDEYKEQIEKDMRVDLRDKISYGQVAGVEWSDELLYRKNLQRKSFAGYMIWIVVGFTIGFIIGSIMLDSLAMKIAMGFLYASLWGGIGIGIAKDSEIATLDFVQKSEVDADAVE